MEEVNWPAALVFVGIVWAFVAIVWLVMRDGR